MRGIFSFFLKKYVKPKNIEKNSNYFSQIFFLKIIPEMLKWKGIQLKVSYVEIQIGKKNKIRNNATECDKKPPPFWMRF